MTLTLNPEIEVSLRSMADERGVALSSFMKICCERRWPRLRQNAKKQPPRGRLGLSGSSAGPKAADITHICFQTKLSAEAHCMENGK